MKNIILILLVYAKNKFITVHAKKLEMKTKIKSKLIKVIVTDFFIKKICLRQPKSRQQAFRVSRNSVWKPQI